MTPFKSTKLRVEPALRTFMNLHYIDILAAVNVFEIIRIYWVFPFDGFPKAS